MGDSVLNYWLLVIPFGLGLAIDLFIATLSRFRDDSLTTLNWASALGLTHGLGPAASFALFWAIGEQYPSLQEWLGLLGALLIYLVIYEIIHEEMGRQPVVSLSGILSAVLPTSKQSARHFVIVMSVSWDALLCAPALIPLAEEGHWGMAKLGGAFLTFGFMAGATAYITLKVASQWRIQHFANVAQLVRYKLFGSFVALSVIGGFGVMAFCVTVGADCGLLYSLTISMLLMFFIFIINGKLLLRQARLEALESISGIVD